MNDLFLRTCRGESVERAPVWIMRQAGRYLPEYRELRKKHDFLTMCHTPELAAAATLQPIERFGMDAAILFSDILVPAEPMGFEVTFTPGPVIANPVRTAADVAKIRPVESEDQMGFVYEAIRILRRELDGRAPLIGFAASPFTLAAYLVEGRGSKNFDKVKSLLFGQPATAHELLERVASVTIDYLRNQIAAGAQAVQLFDSWAGLLGVDAYAEFGLPYANRFLDAIADTGVPRIYFALNGAHLMPAMRNCNSEVLGVDWRMPLDRAAELLGNRHVLQGNLDPCVLFASPEVVARETATVLDSGSKLKGHVFNLGHGILPETPIESVETLVRTVRERAG